MRNLLITVSLGLIVAVLGACAPSDSAPGTSAQGRYSVAVAAL